MKKQLLSALALAATVVGLSAQATSIQIPTFDVTRVELSPTVFPFSNSFVNFDLWGNTAQLQIWNDICPQVPGQFSCLAEAQLALTAEFELSNPTEKDEACGITTQTSQVVTVGNKRHQLVVRNYIDADKINCLLADVDYAVELHTEVSGSPKTSVSYLDVKKVQFLPPVTIVKSYILDAAKYSGTYFKNNQPDLVTLTVDHTNLKAHLRMTKSACGKSTGMNVCLAMPRVILAKSFDITPEMTTMDKPFCNDSNYTSEKQVLEQSLLTVIGAKQNRASVVIRDATKAFCKSKDQGFLTLDLTIENTSHLGGTTFVVNSKSQAKLRFTALELN